METHHKRIYETVFIVNATLDDAQIEQVVEKFKEFIVKQGGEIVLLDKWGRKRLAFPIQKKNNGFYVLCEFSAPADIIGKLERHYALEENVMRYLTIQLSEKMLRARQEQLKITENQELAAQSKMAPKPEAPAANNEKKDHTEKQP